MPAARCGALVRRRRARGALAGLAAAFGLAAAIVKTAPSFVGAPPLELRRRAALAGLLSAPLIQAAPALAEGPQWEGRYEDPRHLGCKREIKASGLSLTISGTTGNPGPGCGAAGISVRSPRDPRGRAGRSPEVAGETPWAISATIPSPESQDIVIDFSPKGGPKDLPAKWDGDGIKFADGNKWKKLS